MSHLVKQVQFSPNLSSCIFLKCCYIIIWSQYSDDCSQFTPAVCHPYFMLMMMLLIISMLMTHIITYLKIRNIADTKSKIESLI